MANTYTNIANLWTPAIWEQGMREAVIDTASLLNTPIVTTDPRITAVAEGAGVEANIPFIIEPNPVDQIQQQQVAPDIKNITAGLQKCAILNRVSPLGSSALAKAVSGIDPIKEILAVMANIRRRQQQTALLSQLSGLFDLTSAPNANSGAFKALRYDNFSETGASPAGQYLLDSNMLLDGISVLGRALERLIGGVIVMHSKIETALMKQGQIDVIRNFEGEIVLRQWKGLTVFLDDSLVRAGGTSGLVYYTIVSAPNAIAYGEKPQIATQMPGEVAAIQLDLTKLDTNDITIYDRTRYVLHPQGAKWTGTPALTGGASNTELATVGNWALALNDVRNFGLVVVRTNG